MGIDCNYCTKRMFDTRNNVQYREFRGKQIRGVHITIRHVGFSGNWYMCDNGKTISNDGVDFDTKIISCICKDVS